MTKREAYQQKLEARLDRIAAEIAGLKARADEAKADVRLRLYEEIEALRVRQDGLRQQFDALRTAGDGAWEDVRTGAERAWAELNEALQKAAKRF